MNAAPARYACLLIDRHKPATYSTLHLIDRVWWDWLHQPAPAELRHRSHVRVPLPAGLRTEDGATTCEATSGSFHNDLMHAAVSAPGASTAVRLPDLDADDEDAEDLVREAAYTLCANHGIDRTHVAEGLWY